MPSSEGARTADPAGAQAAQPIPFAERLRFTANALPWRAGTDGSVRGYAWQARSPSAILVLIHGLQSHAQWFAEAGEQLSERGVCVYAVDRRGSGSSPGVKGDIRRYSDWIDDIGAAVELAQREAPGLPLHLAGHCFGANLGLGHCLSRLGRARSLIMLTPGLYVIPDYRVTEKAAILASGLLGGGRRFRVPQDDELFTRDPEVLAWIKADTLGARTVTARCLLQIGRMGGWLRRDLGRLDTPTLVLAASHDRIADNERCRRLLSGARCEWITFEAEHFLLAEPCHDQVVEAMLEWIQREVV
jgi:alpha-beta hydrolase superfamily lysophospholipase